ncbi:MAG: hypothetical protein WKG32_21275, partial [Gemmatimonadaceae bacterium]
GRALNVTMLLEGTVQRVGNRLRVTVRLVNVRNDSTVWADRIEGSSGDIFAMQDTLTRTVVSALATRAGPPTR